MGINKSLLFINYSEIPPGSPFSEPVPGPSTARDYDESPPSRRRRPQKTAQVERPPDDDSDSDDADSDSDEDADNM